MREAVGGSLIYYLVIPIIILFIIFIGFIMSYASAYRAANYAITQIENCQGTLDGCVSGTNTSGWKAVTEAMRTQYSYIPPSGTSITPCYIAQKNGTYVYRVSLPVAFDLPLFGTASIMQVKAETKSISQVTTMSAELNNKCK